MLNGDSSSDILRSKNKKRDEQIRKKVEQELTRRKTTKTQLPTLSKRNTVSSLRPNQAVIILETCRIFEACQLMAAKRTDAVLAVCETGELSGILTDKDIVFRVVSEGLNVMTTRVKDVMTPKPMTVYDQGNRNEALNIMISRKFRHLPVIKNNDDDTTSVVGLLDITKCVFERLDDLERKVIEDQSIINAMEVLEKRGSVSGDRASSLKSEHGCPEISSILADKDNFPRVSVKASVREAAQVMKLHHSTAVLVMGTPDGSEKVGGIFTTKDIVLRVIAGSLEPSVTSVVRVMVNAF